MLPENINPPANNISSVFSSYDGNSLVFVIEKDNREYLAETKKGENNEWQTPVMIDVINNFAGETSYIESPSYNHNASEIFFSMRADNKDSVFNLYNSKKIDGKWQVPTRLPKPFNTSKNETDPCISADGKTFFFVRNTENDDLSKYDCKTIYVSRFYENKWTNPAALPQPISSGCDRYPRIAPDGKSLYFSSIRGENKKDADIYYTKLITKNAWTTPLLVTGTDSELDEFSPTIQSNGTMLFVKPASAKKNDFIKIFSHEIPGEFKPEKTTMFSGTISDLNTNLPIKASINIIDPYSSIILFSAQNDEQTGKYSFILQKGRPYIIDVFKENYSHLFFEYDNTELKNSEEIKNIKLYNNVELILNVFDAEIYQPLQGKITVVDKKTAKTQDVEIKMIDKGRYSMILDIGKDYNIEVEKQFFEKNNFELDLTETVQFSEFEKDIELQPGKVDYNIQLTDKENGQGIQANVEIINLTTNERTMIVAQTDENGNLKVKLRDGNRYEINVSPNGYSFSNTVVDLVNERKKTTKVELTPLKKETKIELNDITFEFNSAELSESSFLELNRVAKLMENNPQIKIEISAHTDDVGAQGYNLKLSDKRAASVVDYLYEKNVDRTKLISKGYGKSNPKYFPIDTEENRARNRRVELKVLEVTN